MLACSKMVSEVSHSLQVASKRIIKNVSDVRIAMGVLRRKRLPGRERKRVERGGLLVLGKEVVLEKLHCSSQIHQFIKREVAL
jgi:hypothetical protein